MLIWQTIKFRTRLEEGQTMAEYGVVLGVIVLGVIVALGFFAAAVTGQITSVYTAINGLVHP
jgi:Flp pilus assembly pilin Flp